MGRNDPSNLGACGFVLCVCEWMCVGDWKVKGVRYMCVRGDPVWRALHSTPVHWRDWGKNNTSGFSGERVVATCRLSLSCAKRERRLLSSIRDESKQPGKKGTGIPLKSRRAMVVCPTPSQTCVSARANESHRPREILWHSAWIETSIIIGRRHARRTSNRTSNQRRFGFFFF